MATDQVLEADEELDARLEPRDVSIATRSFAHTTRRLVVVSNRVACHENKKPDSGGLAVGIRAALRARGGIWFGWSGEIADVQSQAPRLAFEDNLSYATLDLSREEYEQYYIGYANRTLWPLFHYRSSLVDSSRQNYAGYLGVNRRFARNLAPMLQPDDLVWVHDYHLIPLGQELRRLDQQQPIGFFLHTPFPSADLFRVLPNHREIAEMLCAYDLVGFQTAVDLHGFRDYLLRWADAEDLGGNLLRAFGRTVRAAAFPIGIDVDAVAGNAEAAEDSRHMRRLRQSLGGRALMIGVDRLDYSKGLPARFRAYAHLLESYPETHRRIVFMQIAPSSRSEVPEYREISKSLEAQAGHINGRYGEFDWTPLRYINRGFNHPVLTGFFRASRIGLVTPFRDGMNLVAKEFVAAQNPADPGVLVLSCFAGAARQLEAAVMVNPHDIEGMADAILRGLDMPLGERKERWQAMMRVIERDDVDYWRESFVRALSASVSEF